MIRIGLLFFGLAVFSSFLGSVTSTLTHAKRLAMESARRDELVRRYISENGLSVGLGNQIRCCLRQQQERRKRVIEADVVPFENMPETLLMQMHYEVHAPLLSGHPIFNHIREYHHGVMCSLCHAAMSDRAIRNGEEPFHVGSESSKMLIVHSGNFEYVSGAAGGHPLPVKFGQWLSEACLWVSRNSWCKTWLCQFVRSLHALLAMLWNLAPTGSLVLFTKTFA